MASYVEALERKIAELSGIPLDQIRKNQYQNLVDESADIAASCALINGITVAKAASATMGAQNPLIQKTFDLVKAEGDIWDDSKDADQAHLPSIKYLADGWGKLAPHLTADIMEVHFSKHHAGYIKNLNAAHPKFVAAKTAGDNAALNALAGAIMFNGGSHINHTIFWRNMQPNPTDTVPTPSGSLAQKINEDFGSFDAFKAEFTSKTGAVKGSGWGWLAYHKASNKLGVYTTGNQDTVEIVHGAVPILTCDVWEHAYYLQYKNLRPAFIGSWFKLINWDNAQARFDKASAQ